MKPLKVLYFEDEAMYYRSTIMQLERLGCEVLHFIGIVDTHPYMGVLPGGSQAQFDPRAYDVAFVDFKLEGFFMGVELTANLFLDTDKKIICIGCSSDPAKNDIMQQAGAVMGVEKTQLVGELKELIESIRRGELVPDTTKL